VSCHTEKRGPFVFVHLPARVGGCTTCHQPHGSTNPRLLVRSTVRTLCLECHTNTPRTHNLNQSQYQNCIVCHKAVHGSNHDKKFFE
jgi:predicted CXXCH cytochrome family protein